MHGLFYCPVQYQNRISWSKFGKKSEQSKRDTRVHIIEAIKSLKAALEERFEKSEHNARSHISEAIKSLEETLAENSIKSK